MLLRIAALTGSVLGAALVLGCGGQAPTDIEATTDPDPAMDTGATMGPSIPGSDDDSCVPTPCADQGKDCGLVPDGCGDELDCGTCDATMTGGGAGEDNVCGLPCEPLSCDAQGLDCGLVPDGCGSELDCGTCDDPMTCGGAGVDNVCGLACTPIAAIFFDLGETLVEPIGDGMFTERPGAAALVAELQALPIPIGIITNVPPSWGEDDLRALLVNPDFLDEFEIVLMSSQAASGPKPDPGIYTEAYELLTAPPPIEQVAFITEEIPDIADLEVDPTEGARAAGMYGVHLSDGARSPLADHTLPLDDLSAIAEIAAQQWLPCAESVAAAAGERGPG